MVIIVFHQFNPFIVAESTIPATWVTFYFEHPMQTGVSSTSSHRHFCEPQMVHARSGNFAGSDSELAGSRFSEIPILGTLSEAITNSRSSLRLRDQCPFLINQKGSCRYLIVV